MFEAPEELSRKIRLGEDSKLELKAVYFRGGKVDRPQRSRLADEIAGMANTAGGTLVLGVEDKTREVLGIPLDRLEAAERFVFEICNETVKPPIRFQSLREELPDGAGDPQPVLLIHVPRSLFVHESPGGYFYRQGSSNRKMPPDVLARLFQQRSQARLIRFDEQPVPGTSPDDLREDLWQRFLAPNTPDPRLTLEKIGILKQDESGALQASVAGVLLCSSEPRRWLPGAFIQAVFYRGTEQDSNYQIDAREIDGPLDQQVLGALAFVRRNMRIGARKVPARQEVPQYSERAVFEALVNAVAHRDYSIYGSKIRLFMFEDRLELYSPGPLPNTVTIESMPLRQSTRNELVTSLLTKCPVEDPAGKLGRSFLMEKRGDGVPIILAESERLSGRTPTYRLIDDAELLLTIRAAPAPADLLATGD